MSKPDFTREVPLPKGWGESVRIAVIQAIALAHYAVTCARGWAAKSPLPKVRLAAQMEQAQNEILLLREELRIKDARMMRMASRLRPHYTQAEKAAILELKAARNLSDAQAARMFLVRPQTLVAWMNRIQKTESDTSMRMPGIINPFPEFVKYLVCRLKQLCPVMGKVRIAQILARAGLHLGTTTIERYLKVKHPKPESGSLELFIEEESQGSVTTRDPDHVWHVDLTTVPVVGGFWVPWLPNALQPYWPFCWWLALVIDHYSRRVMGFAVFDKQPTSLEIRDFLRRLLIQSGTKPKYLICDKGVQFWNPAFKRWCKRKGIEPRFGAVGRHGSIALIERFIRSLKGEYLRHILVPMTEIRMRREMVCYTEWYNRYRPHQGLNGATPLEMYKKTAPANRQPRYEPRRDWPADSGCAAPYAEPRPGQGKHLCLVLRFADAYRRLPIVELREVA